MTALPPFKLLQRHLSIVTVNGQLKINNTHDEFLDVIRMMLRGVPVDEVWYLTQYPDIAAAIEAGDVKSARQHFITSGYFEGRMPSPFQVDEQFYLSRYPDIAEGIERGEIVSPTQHFLDHGVAEGRAYCEF